MSLAGKNVLILGATGYVGSGAAVSFLTNGATVFFTTRDEAKIKTFKQTLTALNPDFEARLVGVAATFESDEAGVKAKAEVLKVLNGTTSSLLKSPRIVLISPSHPLPDLIPLIGRSLDHVVSNIAFALTSKTGVSSAKINELKESLEDGLYSTVVAAQAFFGLVKGRPGASYTVVCGGLSHLAYAPTFWPGPLSLRSK